MDTSSSLSRSGDTPPQKTVDDLGVGINAYNWQLASVYFAKLRDSSLFTTQLLPTAQRLSESLNTDRLSPSNSDEAHSGVDKQNTTEIDASPFNQHPVSNGTQDIRSPKLVGIRKRHLFNVGRFSFLAIIDVLALAIAATWFEIVQHWTGLPFSMGLQGNSLLLVGSTIAMMTIVDGYGSSKAWRKYPTFAWVLLLASIFSITPDFYTGVIAPSSIVDQWFGLLFIWISRVSIFCSVRFITHSWISFRRRQNVGRYKVAIVAEPENQVALHALLSHQDRYRVISVAGSSVLDKSNREEFLDQVAALEVDEIFVDWASVEGQLFLLQHLRASGAIVRLLPLGTQLKSMEQLELLGSSVTAFTLPVNSSLFSCFLLKRIADVLAAAVAILLLSPLMITVAILIKLDSPGPIFYRQVRVGLKGQPFKIWKFRSMVSNAAALQADLEKRNESADGILFKIKQDPRITKLGQFIRRYSIDELPQLFNVVCGQMSLVGPRPLPLRDVQRFSQERFFIRHEVLPGITGAWQVSGRSDVQEFDAAVNMDITYVENWSLSLDLQIILKTFRVVLMKQGAY